MSGIGATLRDWAVNGIPLGPWVEDSVNYLEAHFAHAFDAFSNVLLAIYGVISGALTGVPAWTVIVVLSVLAWWIAGRGVAVFTLLGLLLTLNIGMWPSFVSTLALVLLAELLVVAIGLPLGVLAGVSRPVARVLTPILDFMQTMPPFVYLIPAVTFFGLGVVPGVVATVIFSVPPLIRLTNFGLRQVPPDLLEAADAFGSNDWQKLVKVQLPVAVPTIMTGVNQSIMLNLSMVVIAALIGAEGLGGDVIRGMNTLNVGLGFEAGLAIVVMAIVLDRITQGAGGKPR